MSANARPETQQRVASAEGAKEARSIPERDEGGRHPARRLDLSVGAGGSRGDNTDTDLEQAVRFAPCARHKEMGDLPYPASREPLGDTSRIPSAPSWGARSIAGFAAAANEYSALDSGELGRRVQ
jgi:hypothetical protein